VWVAIALVFVTAVIAKVVRARIKHDSVCTRPPPPVVKGSSIIALFHTFFTRGFRAMIEDQYAKIGSMFTISFLGLKVTFLIGPEVSGHFYQGLDSEISHGRILKFTVPMFGKEVGYGVDATTRHEQQRFQNDAVKPSKLRSHVGPMLQEVEVSNKSPTHLNIVFPRIET
jgi:sterol 14alpha-demethylase